MLRMFGYIIVVSVVGARKSKSLSGLTGLGVVFCKGLGSRDKSRIPRRQEETGLILELD